MDPLIKRFRIPPKNLGSFRLEITWISSSFHVAPQQSWKDRKMTDNMVSLVEIPRILREEYDIAATYRQLYGWILDGRIPATKEIPSGRWMVRSSEVPFIAESISPRPMVID